MLIDKFLGLENKHDPLKTPPGFLKNAINVDVDDFNNIRRRNGYIQDGVFIGNIIGSHELRNKSDSFIIKDNIFVRLSDSKEFITGITGNYIFDDFESTLFMYGNLKYILQNETVIKWGIPLCPQPKVSLTNGSQPEGIYQVAATYRDSIGREGGCSAPIAIDMTSSGALSIEIQQIEGYTVTLYISPPNGKYCYQWQNTKSNAVVWDDLINSLVSPLDNNQLGAYQPPDNCNTVAYYDSKIYLGEYLPKENKTVIWFSKPFSYHWFDKSKDYFIIEGKVLALISTVANLVICTNSAIYYYNVEGLNKITAYGIPSGTPFARTKDGEVYLYSNSGICKLNQFENLTESMYTFPDSTIVNSAIVEQNGYDRFVNLLDNSTPAYNIFED